jgi:predicted  nucleic acid-binding Zn-ribbon protein
MKDLTKQKFDKFKVIGLSSERMSAGKGRTKVTWDCLCNCGKSFRASTDHLLSGHTQSCGCYLKKRIIEAKTTHGRNSRKAKIDPTLAAYKNMKTRCHNENRKEYKNYGARGITIDPDWLGPAGFDHFLRDMGECPEGMTLERKENNEGYGKSNCKWATRAEQNRNRRDSVHLTHNGETNVLMDWCRILRVSQSFIYDRLNQGIEFPEIYRQAREFVVGKHWHEDLCEV